MAKKSDEKVVLERTYNIPLRRGFIDTPRYKRTKRAVSVLRRFISRHMKSEDIRIGRHLNMALWAKGITNPPHHVKVECRKFESGRVMAEIVGAPKEEVREKIVSSRKKRDMTLKDKLQDTMQGALGKGDKADAKEAKEEADKVLDVKPETAKAEQKEEKSEDKAEDVPEEKKHEHKPAKPAKKKPAKKKKE